MLLALPGARSADVELSDSVVMRAAAVAQVDGAFVGSTATITITTARNGTGHVFLDTFPLAEVDMQGSARLAARVASRLSGVDVHDTDFFYVVRTGSQQIGGPSAGAALAVGTVAALNGWKVRDDALLTGTVRPDAGVGPVGGIGEKAAAAAQTGIQRFLFPAGQDTVLLGERIVHLPTYCRDELSIDCVGVNDVYEAVSLMTDHTLERPPVTGNVTGEAFRRRLGPLSQQLVDAAAAIEEEARVALEAAPDVPAKEALTRQLAGANETLERARSAAANGTYYTASSLSFQAAIEAHDVRDASEMIRSDDPQAVARDALARSQEDVDRVRALVDATRTQDAVTFESVGAAQVRILEAETRIARAHHVLANATGAAEIYEALHEGAFASERAKTAEWWLELAGDVTGAPVDETAVAELARDTITTSREEIAYVEAVFAGAGAQGPLREPRESLRLAELAYERGYYAAAMLKALEAGVRASVLLEIAGFGGTVPASRFASSENEAARAIHEARGRGIESFLAQASYEFGVIQPDAQERLTFLGVARVQANLAGLPGVLTETSPAAATSRFQGVPKALAAFPPEYVGAAFAIGLALGVGGGLVATLPRKEDE